MTVSLASALGLSGLTLGSHNSIMSNNNVYSHTVINRAAMLITVFALPPDYVEQ
jgi:hypothetical protein